MKAVLIIYNQVNAERMEYMLDYLGVRGFTFFEHVQGRGSVSGQPHRGTHTWPEMNSAILTVVDDAMVDNILESVKKLDSINEEIGIRAFVLNVENTV